MIIQYNDRVIITKDNDNVLPPSNHVEVHVDDAHASRLQALHSGNTNRNLWTNLVPIFHMYILKLDAPLLS